MPDSLISLVIAPETRRYGTLARQTLLAGFADMHAQARDVGQESWSRTLSGSGEGDDLADRALDALEAGSDRYIALWNLRQATRNLIATMLYHLFEQYTAVYRERCGRLRVGAIDWQGSIGDQDLPSTATVDELRLVANAAKHGEGPAVRQLRELRPSLFENPIMQELGYTTPMAPVLSPFAGEGLFVRDGDLDRYQAAVEGLWSEIAAWHIAHRNGS